MYLRLSEVKLTYAEAITRISNNVDAEAVQHLNDIRLRPFTAENKPEAYTVASFGNAEELLEAILLERRRELAYEGHYRWDLIRTGKSFGMSCRTIRRIFRCLSMRLRFPEGLSGRIPAFNEVWV